MKRIVQLLIISFFLVSHDASAIQDRTNDISNLPLVITNSKYNNSKEPLVLFLSGDGGWYKFEQSIADSLALYGIPTIGFDTKKYFWNRRTPEETTKDVFNCLNYYGKTWKRDHYLLIGYSLGAEILPFIISRFPSQIRSGISMYVLLSPSEKTDFVIHISDMMGIKNKSDIYDVAKEILKLPDVPSLIIFGSEEKPRMPALLSGTDVKFALVPGDHHYKFDSPLIIRKMKENRAF